MKRVRLSCGFALAAFVLLANVFAPAAVLGQGRTIALESFDARIEINRDGSFDVAETLQIRFDGSWNGIQRDISLQHRTGQGRPARLRVDVRGATDASGEALRVEEESAGGDRRVRIWVPGAENATRTVILRYHVRGGLRFFDANDPTGHHDELYWNATGNSWDMPIRSAAATVVLPSDATNVQAWGYTGPEGSTEQAATAEVTGNSVRVAATRPFSPYEGLTVSVTWDPGVVERPGAASTMGALLLRYLPVAVPFLAFFAMFRTWRKHGKDPESLPITVQYEPPSDLRPAELGTLVDHTAEMHDLTATIVDLAVRGYVIIEEREVSRFLGLGKKDEFWFHLRRPRSEWSDLRGHEKSYLGALFAASARTNDPEAPSGAIESVRLKDLENKFYTHLPGIRSAVYSELIHRGFYTKRPDKVKSTWLAAGVGICVLGGAAAIMVSERPWLGSPLLVAIGLIGAGVVVAGFGLAMPTRTVKGARTREAALGFREFLERVEQDRFRRMITSPELFERYLPFAMAFRVEAKWAKAFEDLYRTPPDWYRGQPGSFHTSSFTRSMNRMTTATSSTMSSSPSSSGSGGGGSSGGGSGGGGGSGF